MPLIVQKYGGSSLASADFIKRIARNIGTLKQAGNDVVVVVSAMGKTTDELTQLAHQVSNNPDKREMDMLLSVGERVSISLLAMALQDLGYDAISFTGSQVGIITDNEHTRARILEIRADRLLTELKKNKIVIVAGFQGVSINKEITTLGRGGSDTTAVALGAALKADRVELMKDVDGIYRVDPKIVDSPEIIRSITYKEMEEMASLDAGVIKAESVALAEYYGVKVGVGSSFNGEIGTIISDYSLTPERIKGIAHDKNIIFLEIVTKNSLDSLNLIMSKNIQIYNFRKDKTGVSFYTDSKWKNEILKDLQKIKDVTIHIKENLSMISFIGDGIQPGSKSAQAIFSFIEDIEASETDLFYSNSRISLFVDGNQSENLIKGFYSRLKNNPNIKLT